MRNNVADVLARCLDDIHHGRASIEEALRRYPQYADELAPLLRLALRIPPPLNAEPSAAFRQRARRALQAEIARQGIRSHMARLLDSLRPIRHPLGRGFATTAIAALLAMAVVFGAGAGVTSAAQASLPGEPLYPVKRASEQGRMLVTFGPQRKASYHFELASERLEEVRLLVQAEKPVDPSMVEAATSQLDAGLERTLKIAPSKAQEIIEFSSQKLGQEQVYVERLRLLLVGQPAAQLLLEVEIVLNRSTLIAKAIIEDPSQVSPSISVRAARDIEVEGRITSTDPLRIAGVLVVLPPGAEVDGPLAVGKEAKAEGELLSDGRMVASRIQVKEAEEERRVDLRGPITSADPLRIAGQEVVVGPHTEIRGVMAMGLLARVRGELQDDGSVLASQIEVERLGRESVIRGPVTSLDPLAIAGTSITLAPNVEMEGTLQQGLIAKAEGWFQQDGTFVATEIEVDKAEREREEEVRGTILSVQGNSLAIATESGLTVTLGLTPSTKVEMKDDRGVSPASLQPGWRVRVKYNPVSRTVSEVRVDEVPKEADDKDRGGDDKSGSGGSGDGSDDKDSSGPGGGDDQAKNDDGGKDNSGPGGGDDEAKRDGDGGDKDSSGPGEGDDQAKNDDGGGDKGGSTPGESDETENNNDDGDGDKDGSAVEREADNDTPSADEDEEGVHQLEIEAVIVTVGTTTVVVEDATGSRFTLIVTFKTRLETDGTAATLQQLTVGANAKVEFDPESGIARSIRQKRS